MTLEWARMEISNMSSTAGTNSVFNFSGDGNSTFENPFNQYSTRITFILLFSIVFAMCFLGNIVVLVVFAYSKRMRTRTNLFLANLAVADFCVGVFCVLPSLSIKISPFWKLGRVMCKLYNFVSYLAYTASILLLVVIAVERYIAIMHPLRSRGYFTAPRLLVAQVVVWVVAAVYNIPILLMYDMTVTAAGDFCYLTMPLMNLTAYYMAHFVLWYLVPLTVILVIYGRISYTLWATSSAAVTAVRRDSRSNSVSMAIAQDVGQHNFHHPQHGTTVLSTRCPSPDTGRTCVTYCEAIGENGFGSVVTVGVQAENCNGGGDRIGTGESKRCDSRSPLGGSKSRLVEPEEPSRAGRTPSPRIDSDMAQRLLAYQPRDVNGHIEMATFTRCSSCFSCIHRKAGNNYKHNLDYHHGRSRSFHHVKRSTKKPRNADDYAYELSDVPSSDDYDSYRCRGDGGMNMNMGAVGEGSAKNWSWNGAAQRRVRTHCRISSQRGLTSRRRVIRLLLAVVTIFAICLLPFHLSNLIQYWSAENSPGFLFDYLTPIATVLLYLNCGLNPFIYWMFSDHFRRSLREILCFWKRSRQQKTSLIMLSSPRQHKNSTLKHNAR